MTSPQDNPNRAIEQVREGTTTALTKGRAILDKGKETIASLEAANADLQNDIREAHLKGKALWEAEGVDYPEAALEALQYSNRKVALVHEALARRRPSRRIEAR